MPVARSMLWPPAVARAGSNDAAETAGGGGDNTMATLTTEELVYTESGDGIELQGVAIRPAGVPPREVAAVWVHGAGARFYPRPHVEIGRAVAARGSPVVLGNNRGHHLGTNLYRGGMPTLGGEQLLGGTLWERFEESPHDVAGWVDFAMTLGVRGVVLVGHSRGARKVVYYQAQRQDPRVLGVVLASLGRVDPVSDRDPELLARAERLVAEGRGQDLLPRTRPEPGLSAQTYLSNARPEHDPYGADTPDPGIARVRCPLLLFYGTREPGAAHLEALRRLASGASRVDARVIDGAVHSYHGSEAAVAGVIADWLEAVPRAP